MVSGSENDLQTVVFPQIFVSLQEGNRYMLYRYYNVK